MLYHRIQIGLIFLFLGLGVLLHFRVGLTPAWYLYAAAVILLLTHFLFGTVWRAFANMKKGELIRAERLLNQIQKPEWLARGHRAYYHFTKGMIALQKKELETGESHLNKAMELGLRSDTDKALATLNLAHVAYVQKKYDLARTYLHKTKSFKAKDLMIEENLKKLESALAKLQ